MADKAPDQEPSIEEILASIRQIISDDDEKPADAAPAPAPEPEPEPEEEPAPADDVLELTPAMQEEPEEEEDDIEIDLMDHEEPPAAPRAPVEEDDTDILSEAARQATMASLAKLTGHMPISRTRGYEGTTLEDIVRELLHPMLRDWMDSNVPKMVERLVQKELEKLARRAMDE